MENMKKVSLVFVSLFLVGITCVAQNDWHSSFYKLELQMLLSKELNTKDVKELHQDGTIPYYHLQNIAYYILPKEKALAEKLLIECAEYGIMDTTKLNQSTLSIKSKEKIESSYFNKVDQYHLALIEEISGLLAVEQHYRKRWMKSRFTDSLALIEMKKLDSLNFSFIDGIIKEKRIPVRGEFKINYAPLFLHVTSERFADDTTGFENYRQVIFEMVKTNHFDAGLYALWVDRYYVWHLKSDKQVFGVFRDIKLSQNELPEVIDHEMANHLRSEIGLRTMEEELEYRKLLIELQKSKE